MVEAIRDGETDPAVLAELADPRLKAKPDVLRAALNGRVTAHQRIMLGLYLDHIDATERAIARAFEAIWQRVEAALMPFRKAVALIVTVPGVGPDVAASIVAETGDDMKRFPSEGHLISWAG